MKKITEIRWHGRGGQGAKTAATLLADVALSEGKFAQGFPEYGPERMGAPMRGFTRIAEEPIRVHCGIYHPDIVVVLDETLFDLVDIIEGLPEDGKLLVNTPCSPAELRKKYKLKGMKIYTVEATIISIEELGRDMPNTPMMGALAKVAGFPKLETLVKDMDKKFSHKFAKKVVDDNIRAVERAYKEVKGE
jgi:pyruvate ferredoxin oxidoreductase gamma subunit